MPPEMQNPPVTAGSAGADLGRAQHRQYTHHVEIARAEILLQRLNGVQRAGSGWRARCPACGGKSRKVAIREADGKVLLHCFGCGDAPAVLASVGLTWADLQPPKTWPETPAERHKARRALREMGWSAALQTLALEATVVLLASRDLARWQPLSEDDDRRLAVAVERIDRASAVLCEAAAWRPAVRE